MKKRKAAMIPATFPSPLAEPTPRKLPIPNKPNRSAKKNV